MKKIFRKILFLLSASVGMLSLQACLPAASSTPAVTPSPVGAVSSPSPQAAPSVQQNTNAPSTLVNDLIQGLQKSGACLAAFSSYAGSIHSSNSVTVNNLNLGGALNFSAGSTLSQYGYIVDSMQIEPISNMVPLNGVGSARIGRLVFHGHRMSNQSSVTMAIDQIAFYLSTNGQSMSNCQVRPYALVPNLFSIRAALESPSVPAQEMALYQLNKSQAITLLSTSTFDTQIPPRGNMAWALMDRLYPLGAVALLSQYAEINGSPIQTTQDFTDRAITDLMLVANGSSGTDGYGFNFTNWFQAYNNPNDLTQTLQGSQTGLAVAVGLDWFRNSLTADQKTQLITALQNKALNIFNDSYKWYANTCTASCTAHTTASSWWISSPSNWNLVNNGSLLVMLNVLSYEVDPVANPTLATMMQTLFHEITVAAKPGDSSSISYGLASLQADGGWYEGPGYWSYAMENFASAMNAYQANELTLPAGALTTGVDNALTYGLAMRNAQGRSFNYSDGDDGVATFPSMFWLASMGGNANATNIEYNLEKPLGFMGYETSLSLFWANSADFSTATPGPAFSGLANFPSVNVAAINDTSSGSQMYVGMKGAVSLSQHRQEDAGEFIFDADGVRWAPDIGRDNYGLSDYGSGYIYYRQRPDGNNSLSVDDEYLVQASTNPLTIQTENSKSITAQVDLTAAYKAGSQIEANGSFSPGVLASHLSSLKRTFTVGLQSKLGYLLVHDEITPVTSAPSLPDVIWSMNLPSAGIVSSSHQQIVLSSTSVSGTASTLRIVPSVTGGTLESFEVVAPPVMSAAGPFFQLVNNAVSYFLEGDSSLPTGVRTLQIVVTPSKSAPTEINVYLIPGSSSFQAPAN